MGATLTRVRGPALVATALLIAFLIVSPGLAASRSVVVVKTAKNATLGKTILVGLNGHTLYDLGVVASVAESPRATAKAIKP